ncbi:winged helix-turn-helix transcriptional regulator [Kocuria coralli]|uniref:Winged helix-turn-helix transcriptional regulator n=1 Tax=Kocuria coralli TaxID=1461025 RepID=A0A5J5L003_9MICC|nr:metalloregulator ArsR/SmtB family transcription factor [Kocuria coralli]KAA9395297.1 winged helix-turn-helix transcriptional regulator [Kocuria coralli]
MTQDVFSVLADPTRRAILDALHGGESPVGDLVEAVGASQPTVSKHLRILREAGLVDQRAEGQKRFYSVRPEGLAPAARWLAVFSIPGDAVAAAVPPGIEKTADGPAPGELSEEPVRPVTRSVEPEGMPRVLDPHVVRQDDGTGGRGGFLQSVFRRRRR